jgi:hypothetical protein
MGVVLTGKPAGRLDDHSAVMSSPPPFPSSGYSFRIDADQATLLAYNLWQRKNVGAENLNG